MILNYLKYEVREKLKSKIKCLYYKIMKFYHKRQVYKNSRVWIRIFLYIYIYKFYIYRGVVHHSHILKDSLKCKVHIPLPFGYRRDVNIESEFIGLI